MLEKFLNQSDFIYAKKYVKIVKFGHFSGKTNKKN